MEGVLVATDVEPAALSEELLGRGSSVGVDPLWGQNLVGRGQGPHCGLCGPGRPNEVRVADQLRGITRLSARVRDSTNVQVLIGPG